MSGEQAMRVNRALVAQHVKLTSHDKSWRQGSQISLHQRGKIGIAKESGNRLKANGIVQRTSKDTIFKGLSLGILNL
jgi:hypothetical protein